jgi:hypothetical protein
VVSDVMMEAVLFFLVLESARSIAIFFLNITDELGGK